MPKEEAFKNTKDESKNLDDDDKLTTEKAGGLQKTLKLFKGCRVMLRYDNI